MRRESRMDSSTTASGNLENCAPVVVFAYNRADQVMKVLESLDRNRLADRTDLYLFSDGPRNEKAAQKVNDVRLRLKAFSEHSHFRSVTLHFAEHNQGLARSVISGVSEIIARCGKVIVVEDDLLCNSNFLAYMNDCLDFYESNAKIWSISGYTYPLPSLQRQDAVYAAWRGSSWGWATWKDRWETMNWDISTYPDYHWNLSSRHRLSRAGHDLVTMLDNQKKGAIDSWAVRWVYQQCMSEKMTIYPPRSLVHNIGLDGSGTHGVTSGNEIVRDLSEVSYQLVPDPSVSSRINAEFLSHYRSPLLIYIANTMFDAFHIHKHLE